MTTKFLSTCSLEETIDQGRFFEVDDLTILKQIREAFPDELERLKNAYAVERGSPLREVVNGSKPKTPSEILYGANFDEINRTLVGVLALRWIHNGDYQTFTGPQPEAVKLQKESFEWMRDLFARCLPGPKDIFALVTSMIINDLGKDPELENDFYLRTTISVSGMNHDMILLEAAKAGMIPCLDRLDESQRDDIMRGLELGSELNAGQLAQAENVPINLEGLLHMRGHEHSFDLKFMEQILDVAGSAGHSDATCARKLIEPVFQAFKVVQEVAMEIIEGKSSLREAYDKVLTKRGDMLKGKGFRRLTVHDDDQRALLRLLTMGRTADPDQAELFSSAFEDLDPDDRKRLVKGLNVDGNDGETAVLPYYMPAMLSEVIASTRDMPFKSRKAALQSLMRYLGRVLDGESHFVHPPVTVLRAVAEDVAIQNATVPGIVIERNVMRARETISSDEFRKNPNVLDTLDIPAGQILQRRRTSQSL